MNTASLDTLLAPHLAAAVRGDRDAYGRVVARCQNSVTATAGAATAKTFGKVLLGSAGAVGIAILAAFAGIFFETRKKLRGAIDERERHELIRSALVSAGTVVTFLLGIVAATAWTTTWHAPIALTVVFFGLIMWQEMVVQPRAMARRHALDAARDPEGAARRRRRERIIRWASCGAGTTIAIAALLYGLIASGRL